MKWFFYFIIIKVGYTPLHLASYYGQPEIVQMLLADPRVDVNIDTKVRVEPVLL